MCSKRAAYRCQGSLNTSKKLEFGMINDIALAVSTARLFKIERLADPNHRRVDHDSAFLRAGIEKSAGSPNLSLAFSLLRQRLAGGSMVALLSRRLGTRSAGMVHCKPVPLILRRVFGAHFCKLIEQGVIVLKYIRHQRATGIEPPNMFGWALRVISINFTCFMQGSPCCCSGNCSTSLHA
jgi:hypothetical protein